MENDFLDELAPGYYDKIFNSNSIRKYWHYFKFLNIISEVNKDSLNLLDIGCASGTFVGKFFDDFKGLQKTGLDISRRQVEYAQKHYADSYTNFLCGRIIDFTLKENSFDVVTCSEVIEHLPLAEIKLTLEVIFNILKPQGKLIITTPDYHSFWPLLEILVDIAFGQHYSKMHIETFNKQSLSELLKNAGFRVERLRNILGLSPIIAPITPYLSNLLYPYEFYGALILCVARKTV